MKGKRRLFYVIYIEEPAVRKAIDALRLIFNPKTNTAGHVTVRGPYNKEIGINDLNKKGPSKLRLYGADRFFSEHQNTVFIRCEAPELRDVWKKFDYPYNPHLTVYDGASRKLAQKLFCLIKNHKIDLQASTTELKPLVIQGQTPFSGYRSIDDSLLREWLSDNYRSVLQNMSDNDKFILVRQVLDWLSEHGETASSSNANRFDPAEDVHSAGWAGTRKNAEPTTEA